MARLVIATRSNPMSDGRYRVYVELRHKRLVKKKATQYECDECDKTDNIVTNGRIISCIYNDFLREWEERLDRLEAENKVAGLDIDKLYEIISGDSLIGGDYGSIDFLKFAITLCEGLKKKGRGKLAVAYMTVVNSLQDYTGKASLLVRDMTLRFIDGYVDYLQGTRKIERNGVTYVKDGLCNQSMNNRMKDFKALFNVFKKEYCDPVTGEAYIRSNPFCNWKPLVLDNTNGYKAVSRDVMLRIFNYTPVTQRSEIARDMFILSFLLIGINATDLYSMEQESLSDGRLNYRRSKTKDRRSDGAFISIKVPTLAIPIMKKYAGRIRLFNFCERYSSLGCFNKGISIGMQEMCRELGIPNPTYYGARHSWGTFARNDCGMTVDDIAVCLNHSGAHDVTDRYIKRDWSLIDRCNEKVIGYVFSNPIESI